jgi:hypothetical protein
MNTPQGLLETRSPGKPTTPADELSNQQQQSGAALAGPDRSLAVGGRSGGRCLELVAQRVVIAACETAFFPLALTRFDQVL